MQSAQWERAKEQAFRYLAYRPRTELEISTRLRQKSFPPDLVDQLIDYLREIKMLDDRSFALDWVRFRLKERKRGKRYLYRELLQKGVDKETAAEAMASFSEEEEYNVAVEQAGKRLKNGYSWPSTGRFLERRGFSGEQISKVYRMLNIESPRE